jgi:hypothetical protein
LQNKEYRGDDVKQRMLSFIFIQLFFISSVHAVNPVALSKERSLILGFIAGKVRNYPKTTLGDRPAYTVVYSSPNYMNYNAYIQSRTASGKASASAPAATTTPASNSRSPASVDGNSSEKADEKSLK